VAGPHLYFYENPDPALENCYKICDTCSNGDSLSEGGEVCHVNFEGNFT